MENTEFLDNYEKTLEQGLVKLCSGAGLLDGELLRSPDIDGKWDEYIRDYIADAVGNFNDYPEAAIAWAAFLGLAVAFNWDKDWKRHSGDRYTDYYGSRGWDDMDEHTLNGLLGLDLDGEEARKISDTLQSCAYAALGLIRHENIESQTATGFYVLSRTYSVMFRIGESIGLKRLGYRKVPVSTGEFSS